MEILLQQKKFYDKKIDYGIGGYSFLKKRSYTVQNNFELEQTEIMLVNLQNRNFS